VVVVAVSLVLMGAHPAAASPHEPEATSSVSFQVDQQTTNNSTRHEHPDRVSGSQDLESVRGWLAERMSAELESCIVEVGIGTTNVCEFDDQYPDWVGQYVEVADETDEEDDDRRAEVFEETKDDHESYSRAVANFTRTYEAYQEAKAAGDDERARALARELQRQGNTVSSQGEEILREYRVLEEESTVSLDDAKTAVNATVENVSETVETVEVAEFIPTVLLAELTPSEISFLAPGSVTGRLTTQNGTPIANRTIDLQVGDRALTTRTDETGRFTLEYRPTTLPVSTDRLEVQYEPRDESPYLGNRTTVPVSIEPVEPVVDVSLATGRAAFGDEIRVTGSVSAEGIGAPDVPVRIVLDGRAVGTVRTDESGRFSTNVTIHASDGPGGIPVRAVVALEDRALASTADSTAVTIEETRTSLTLDPGTTGSREVVVDGRLTTRDGIPVSDQPVTLLVNGTAVESVRTDAEGAYQARIEVPASLLADEGDTTVGLVARFDGSGTNLDGATGRTVLSLPATGGASEGFVQGIRDMVSDSALWWALGLLAVGLLAVLLYFRDRVVPGGTARRSTAPDSSEAEPEPAGGTGAEASHASPIESARQRLDGGPDHAVMLAYAAVRDRLAESRQPRRSAETHWEFLAACRQDGLDADTIDELTALTQTYEAAAYAPVSVSAAEAEAAVEAAERLVG
jgi:hypothetical protein